MVGISDKREYCHEDEDEDLLKDISSKTFDKIYKVACKGIADKKKRAEEFSKIREKYLDFTLHLLKANEIKNILIYEEFLSGNIYENIGKNFLYNDIHYNAEGNKIIANTLIQALKE